MRKVINGKMLVIIVVLVAIILFGVLGTIVVGNVKTKTKVSKQLSLGEKFLETLDYKQAVLAFEKAIEIDDKSVEAYKKLATAYKMDGQMDKAVETLWKGYKKTGDESLKDMLGVYEEMEQAENELEAVPKETKTPTQTPTQSPEKAANDQAHKVYAKMYTEKDCKTINNVYGGEHFSKNENGTFTHWSGEKIECNFMMRDLNQDGVDELIVASPATEDYYSETSIFTWSEGQVRLMDTVYGDQTSYTEENLSQQSADQVEYEKEFRKPNVGESLLYFNEQECMFYSGNYNPGGNVGPFFEAYRIGKETIKLVAYCSHTAIGDTSYSCGLDYKEVSRSEYKSYLAKHFSNLGENIKFISYKEFLKECGK